MVFEASPFTKIDSSLAELTLIVSVQLTPSSLTISSLLITVPPDEVVFMLTLIILESASPVEAQNPER
jgi:hypothetical protein